VDEDEDLFQIKNICDWWLGRSSDSLCGLHRFTKWICSKLPTHTLNDIPEIAYFLNRYSMLNK